MSRKVYSKGNAKPDKDQYMRQICTMDGGLNMSHIPKKWYSRKYYQGTHAQHKSLNLHQQQEHWTVDNNGEHSPTNPVSDNATELVTTILHPRETVRI